MNPSVPESSSHGASPHGHLRFPLRGLASEGAEHAVRNALANVPGILRIAVSNVMAVAEVEFDERVVSAEEVRAHLERAGQQSPGGEQEGIP